jgi:hypothetical protein
MSMNNTNQEIKFNIYGEMFHSDSYSRMVTLSYIASTREEALVTCKRNNPKFHIMSIKEDHSEVEVVKLQSLSI